MGPKNKNLSHQQVNDLPPAGESVLKSAALMSLATLSSRVLGMFRDMAMAALFPRIVTDAYVVAFQLPNRFRRILGEGSLSASFVPLYVEASEQNKDEAREFSNAVFSMLSVLTAALSVLGVIYMEPIMASLVGGQGYMNVPGKFELTVFLARLMFSYLFFVTTYAFYMGLANAHKIFFIPALAPAAFNLATIVFAFTPQWRMQGDQLAYGVLLGGLFQLVMTLYPLIKLNISPRFTFNWAVPRVKQFFQIVIPSMLGMSVAQLLGVINVYFGSKLPQGTHSYIYLADRLLEFPQSLLSVSLGVALLPTLAELWVKNEKEKFLTTAQKHIRLLMVLSIPSAVGLFVLSEPIVRVLYARGEFSDADVMQTGKVLSIYALVLIVTGLHRVTVPCFYAIKNTWLPAANSAFCLVVHFFIANWATDHFGLQGLVGATAFTGFLNLAVLLISYKIVFGDLGAMSFFKSIIWLSPSVLVMGAIAPVINDTVIKFSNEFMPLKIAHILGLTMSIVISSALFFWINNLMKHPESKEIIGIISRRFRKKIRPN